MVRSALWEIWTPLLAAAVIAAGLVAFVALVWLAVTDPGRADAWVWGLAAVSVAGDLVAAVRKDTHRLRRPRLAGLVWLATAAVGALLVLGAGGAIIGYVLAASAALNLPDAAGLWPGQAGREPSAPR